MSFFSDLFSNLVAPFKKAVDGFKIAQEEKSLPKTITALGDVISVHAVAAENIGSAMKETGRVLSGPQKHDMVKNAVTTIASTGINRVVDIPGIDERQEQFIFGSLFGPVIDFLIHEAVGKLNKSGWKLT